MNLNTYQMISTYFEHIRPCYRGKSATETMTPFFLTKQGEQLSNSQFDKVVKRMTGRDISLTKNRKQSVTNRKRSGASEQELNNLAEHMTHSVNTQKGYYDTDTKVNRSVEVFEGMATLRTSIGTSHVRRLKSPTVAEEEQPEDVPDPDDLYPKPQSVTPSVAEEEQPEDVPDPDDLYPKPQSVTPSVAEEEQPEDVPDPDDLYPKPQSVTPSVAEEEQPEDVPDPDDLYPKPQSVTPSVAEEEQPEDVPDPDDLYPKPRVSPLVSLRRSNRRTYPTRTISIPSPRVSPQVSLTLLVSPEVSPAYLHHTGVAPAIRLKLRRPYIPCSGNILTGVTSSPLKYG